MLVITSKKNLSQIILNGFLQGDKTKGRRISFQSISPCLLKYEISLQMNALALLTLQIFEPGPV